MPAWHAEMFRECGSQRGGPSISRKARRVGHCQREFAVSIVEGFADLTFAEILELGATLGQVPSGRVVGIWTLADDCYSLFDRTPQQRVISR